MVKQNKPLTTGFRFTPEDKKIVDALRKKLGANVTQVIRQGIRALATKEGVSA